MAGAGLLQERVVANAPLPEAKIIADDQVPDLAAPDQHLLDEFVGRQGSEAGIKRADHGLPGAAISQQFELFAQRGQTGGRGLRRKKFARMRLEGQHHGRQLALPGHFGQTANQRGVTEMHAIEITDGEHDGSRNGTRVAAKDAHESGGGKNVEL